MADMISAAGPNMTPLPMRAPERPHMAYSDKGAQIATDVYTRAKKESTAHNANSILWKGYDTILQSTDTTDDEKAIARYGSAISQATLNIQEHNRLGFNVISSLAHPVPGPVGTVLGKLVNDTAKKASLAMTANQALWKGCDLIANHPGTTNEEKAVAKLGRLISHDTLDVVEHCQAGYKLIGTISAGVTGPAGPVIASAAFMTAQKVIQAKTANHVIWEAYKVIIDDSSTTAEEKAIAKLGDRLSHKKLEVTEHNLIAYHLMDNLKNLPAAPVGNLLAQAANKAANNVKYADTANHIFWTTYSEILATPGIDPALKIIATLGDAMAHHPMKNTSHNRISFPLFKIMEEPITSPVIQALVDATTVIADNVGNADIKHTLYHKAFKIMADSDDVPPLCREIARKGMDIDSMKNLSADEKCEFSVMVMEYIGDSAGIVDQASTGDPAHLRALEKSIRDRILEQEKDITLKEQEIRDKKPLLQEQNNSYDKAKVKYNRAFRVEVCGWIGGIAAGAAALVMAQPLLAIPLAIPLLSHFYQKRTAAALLTSQTARNATAQTVGSDERAVAASRHRIDFLNSELQFLKPQLDTLAMADAVSSPVASGASMIINDNADPYIVIGGLRLRKNTHEYMGGDKPSLSESESSSQE